MTEWNSGIKPENSLPNPKAIPYIFEFYINDYYKIVSLKKKIYKLNTYQ